jgi:hypothetical protein
MREKLNNRVASAALFAATSPAFEDKRSVIVRRA